MSGDEVKPNPEEDESSGMILPGDAGDKELRPKVESLMADGGGLAEALAEGAFGDLAGEETMAPTEIPRSDATEIIHTETQIGPFKLIEEIGAGGFGTVHLAEQTEPVERQVALKIIKLGMDSKEIIARFAAERQVLAMMDHPNIATVLDAGTTNSGRPYFVMELVKGIPITRYCDQNKLSTYERLQLFLQVCAAIQHAHQKGVIHRDIKPSNILVTTADSKPMVKVIDFGIAKALDQSGGEHTVLTMFGQIIGTPQYMSPEQADDTTHDIDTRSDIYSLGVLLYELLTGSTPICPDELRKAGVGEIQRIIRELQPRKPSTRVTGKDADDESSVILTRGEAPQRVVQLLKGDLDWIVMKAIEKDRDRRYDTARGLARDIECFLNNEPVSASPPTMFYLLGKFAARNRKLIASLSAIAVSLVAGVVGMTFLYFEAETNRQQAVLNLGVANAERKRAENAKAATEEQRIRAERESDRRRRLLYASDMQLAARNWESPEGTAHSVAGLLTAHVPLADEEDLREFAWRHQWQALNRGAKIVAVELDLTDAVVSTRDQLLTLGGDFSVRTWSGSGNRPVREIRLPLEQGSDDLASFTPDGRQVVHVGGGFINVFDAETGKKTRQLPAIRNVQRFVVSADSRYLGLLESGSMRLYLLDLQSDRGLVRFGNYRTPVIDFPLAVSPGATNVTVGNLAGNGVVSMRTARGRRNLRARHRVTIQSIAWSGNGRYVASGDGGGMVTLRRTDQLAETQSLRAHSTGAMQLCFSPDGKLLASGDKEGGIVLIHTETMEPTQRMKGHAAKIRTLRFSPTGEQLVSTADDGTARLWKLGGIPGVRPLKIRYVGVSITNDGTGSVVTFNGLSGEDYVGLTHGKIQPGDRILGVDVGDGVLLDLAPFNAERIHELLQGKPGGELRLRIDSAEDEKTRDVVLRRGEVSSDHVSGMRIKISPDGRWLVTFAEGQTLLIDRTGRRASRWFPHRGDSFAFSADSRLLAFNDSRSSTVVLWDIEEQRQLDSWELSPVGEMAFSPDGGSLAASVGYHLRFSRMMRDPGEIHVWHLTKRRNTRLSGHVGYISGMAFSPDGRHLATAGQDGTLVLWDAASWKRLATSEPVGEKLACLTWSGDSRHIVAGGWDGTTFIWNREAKLIDSLEGHSAQVTALDFSADQRTLATASRDGTAKLWDFASRQQLRSLNAHESPLLGLAFAPDGNSLITGGRLTEAIVWEAPPLNAISEDPLTINSLRNLAGTFMRRGPFDRAADLYRRVADLEARRLGGRHAIVLAAVGDHAKALRKAGNLALATQLMQSNLVHCAAEFGSSASRTRDGMTELQELLRERAMAAHQAGAHGEAVAFLENGIEFFAQFDEIDSVALRELLQEVKQGMSSDR